MPNINESFLLHAHDEENPFIPRPKHPHNLKPKFVMGGVVMLLLVMSASIFSILTAPFRQHSQPSSVGQSYLHAATQPMKAPPTEEQRLINLWILQNDLNIFGDTKSTIYPGGVPLDSLNGDPIERFTYIIQNHPDRPWMR